MPVRSRISRLPNTRTEVAGLDALEAPLGQAPSRSGAAPGPPRGRRSVAITIAFAAWELVVLSGWKPTYVLPQPVRRPRPAGGQDIMTVELWSAVGDHAASRRLGVRARDPNRVRSGGAVSRFSRSCGPRIGSFISGLQSMPSIAWFPLAILLFEFTE